MRYLPIQAALAFAVVLIAAPAAAAEGPVIEWTMPDRLGPDLDGDGLIDIAGNAASVASGPFTVVLEVRSDRCGRSSVYHWSVEGRLVGGGRAECRFSQRFAAEGDYRVGLEIEESDGERTAYSRTITVQDWLIVSIGDSVASGEGNPDQSGLLRRARWQSPRCHRSSLAAPVLAAKAIESADPQTSTTLVHLACSGAALRTGLLEGYEGADVPADADPRVLPAQMNELAGIASQRHVDAVLLSIGANDLHFSAVVKFCLRFGKCDARNFDPEQPLRKLRDEQAPKLPVVIDTALARLREGYAELGVRLAENVEPSRVVIVDYFDPTHGRDGQPCARISLPFLPFPRIDAAEAAWAYNNVLAPLNGAIAAAAAREGWMEVGGVAEAFRTHGYCAGGGSWIRSIGRSIVSQAGSRVASRGLGGLHPNEEGHRQTAKLIVPVLQRVLSGDGEPAATTASTGIVPGSEDGEPDESGEETEQRAAIGLLVAAVLAAIGLGTMRLKSVGRADAPAAPGRFAELPPPPQPPPRQAVQAFSELLESSNEWVHRRVESIEFLDERTIRRRVSVDFTPTSGALPGGRHVHVPVALLHKAVLTRFDLRDEVNGSLPLLTSSENAAFAMEHMLSIAEEVSPVPIPARLRELCWTVALGEPRAARKAEREIFNKIEPPEVRESLRRSDRFRTVTSTFAQSFAVIVPIEREEGRRVIKLAYDQVVGGGPRGLARLGLRAATLVIDLPQLGDAGSRHVEFLRAEGLEAFEAGLLTQAPGKEPVIRPVDPNTDSEAHLFAAGEPRGTRGMAGVRLRAQRKGILVGGPLLAGLAAASLSAAWFALPELAGNSGDGASVLLAVPAALGAYLGARDPHPLVAAMLMGARALLFVSGVLSFVAAGALALDASVEALRIVLGGAAVLSWATFGGLVAIAILPRRPKHRRRP